MEEPSTYNLFNKRRFQLKNHSQIQRLSPERAQSLFKKLENYSTKFSPSNCSKNILAISSNLDNEIDNAKIHSFTPNKLRNLSQVPNLSPIRRISKLPQIEVNKNKYNIFKKHPFSNASEIPPVEVFQNKNISSSRVLKINKLLSSISGFKSRFLDKRSRMQLTPHPNALLHSENQTIEEKIITSCEKHCEEIEKSDEDDFKLNRALKRTKKIWKQNHLAFMKDVDRLVYSIKNLA